MDPIIAGSLISGASSLLGGLFGGDTMSPGEAFRSQFNARMKMGDKYGISKLVMAGVPPVNVPGQSGGDSIGNAIADMGQSVGRAVSSIKTGPEKLAASLALERARKENDLLDAQIASINARTARESAPGLPSNLDIIGGQGGPDGTDIPVTTSPALPLGDGAMLPEPTKLQSRIPGLNLFGTGVEANPYFSDAGGPGQQRYGEPGEWLLGISNMIADYYWNTRWMNSPRLANTAYPWDRKKLIYDRIYPDDAPVPYWAYRGYR